MTRPRVDWLAPLAFVHRWLGIAFGLLFLAWLGSGIVMMYARMPAVTPEERLRAAEPLDLAALSVAPQEAVARAGLAHAGSVQLGMQRGRPVYVLPGAPRTIVFADTGERLPPLQEHDALAVARRFLPEHAAGARAEARLAETDQWTLQLPQHLPMHRIAFADPDDTRVYVSGVTGEVVMKTTRRERLLAYAGPVVHWLYLPALRRNGPLWTRLVVGAAGIGCLVCLGGLVVGASRLSRGGSPYAGPMEWHHRCGLAFGVLVLGWTFSGLLSMGPWRGLANPGLTSAQRRAIAGAAPPTAAVSAHAVRAAADALGRSFKVRQMTLLPFRGDVYWLGEDWTGQSLLVPALRPDDGAFPRFTNAELEAAARDAIPGVPVEDAVWLARSDAYYYDRGGGRALPVLRARFADAERTWLYLDPRRGEVVMASSRGGRFYRWLYRGLHSFDFPLLYHRRPLWDAVVIAGSLGGIAVVATSLLPGWRRARARLFAAFRP